MKLAPVLAAIAALLIGGPATASGPIPTIRYEFTGVNPSLSGSFTYVSQGFVSSFRNVPAAGLESCVVTTPVGGACGNQIFIPDYAGNASVVFMSNGPAVGYFFEAGALSRLGTHVSPLVAEVSSATLKVSQMGGAVPEPAAWALMIIGFGLVGTSNRRRSTALVHRNA